MTPVQKTLVQQSFKQVVPIADTAATIFYERLFAIAPAVRPLFKGDLAEQKKKLVQMLAYCVSKLDAPDELLPAVRALGKRHVTTSWSARRCSGRWRPVSAPPSRPR